MKLLVCSDLHVDANERMAGINIIPFVISALKKRNPDAIVIAGDISGSAVKSLDVIRKIEKEIGVPVYFVPGNHDIWTQGEEGSSWQSYKLLYEHSSSLLNHTLVHGNTAVIGGMSWYDYSFGPMGIQPNEFSQKKKKYWNDAKYAKWNQSDESLCLDMIDKLKEKIEQNKDKKIILVNHYLPYEDFVTLTGDYQWNFCNAYMGSEKLGQLIDTYSNIETVIFGHTHRRYGIIEDYRGKTIICKPLGYVGEWESESVEEEIDKVISEINI